MTEFVVTVYNDLPESLLTDAENEIIENAVPAEKPALTGEQEKTLDDIAADPAYTISDEDIETLDGAIGKSKVKEYVYQGEEQFALSNAEDLLEESIIAQNRDIIQQVANGEKRTIVPNRSTPSNRLDNPISEYADDTSISISFEGSGADERVRIEGFKTFSDAETIAKIYRIENISGVVGFRAVVTGQPSSDGTDSSEDTDGRFDNIPFNAEYEVILHNEHPTDAQVNNHNVTESDIIQSRQEDLFDGKDGDGGVLDQIINGRRNHWGSKTESPQLNPVQESDIRKEEIGSGNTRRFVLSGVKGHDLNNLVQIVEGENSETVGVSTEVHKTSPAPSTEGDAGSSDNADSGEDDGDSSESAVDIPTREATAEESIPQLSASGRIDSPIGSGNFYAENVDATVRINGNEYWVIEAKTKTDMTKQANRARAIVYPKQPENGGPEREYFGENDGKTDEGVGVAEVSDSVQNIVERGIQAAEEGSELARETQKDVLGEPPENPGRGGGGDTIPSVSNNTNEDSTSSTDSKDINKTNDSGINRGTSTRRLKPPMDYEDDVTLDVLLTLPSSKVPEYKSDIYNNEIRLFTGKLANFRALGAGDWYIEFKDFSSALYEHINIRQTDDTATVRDLVTQIVNEEIPESPNSIKFPNLEGANLRQANIELATQGIAPPPELPRVGLPSVGIEEFYTPPYSASDENGWETPENSQLKFTNNNEAAKDILEEMATIANARWWVDRYNNLNFGKYKKQKLNENSDQSGVGKRVIEFLIEADDGQATPPYNSVAVIGDSDIEAEGEWGYEHVVTNKSKIQTARVITSEEKSALKEKTEEERSGEDGEVTIEEAYRVESDNSISGQKEEKRYTVIAYNQIKEDSPAPDDEHLFTSADDDEIDYFGVNAKEDIEEIIVDESTVFGGSDNDALAANAEETGDGVGEPVRFTPPYEIETDSGPSSDDPDKKVHFYNLPREDAKRLQDILEGRWDTKRGVKTELVQEETPSNEISPDNTDTEQIDTYPEGETEENNQTSTEQPKYTESSVNEVLGEGAKVVADGEVVLGQLQKPVFKYKNTNVRTPAQLKKTAIDIAEKLAEQKEEGKITVVGRPDLSLLDIVVLPGFLTPSPQEDKYKYTVRSIEHTLDSNGFTSNVEIMHLLGQDNPITRVTNDIQFSEKSREQLEEENTPSIGDDIERSEEPQPEAKYRIVVHNAYDDNPSNPQAPEEGVDNVFEQYTSDDYASFAAAFDDFANGNTSSIYPTALEQDDRGNPVDHPKEDGFKYSVKQNEQGNPVYETEPVFTYEEAQRAKDIVQGDDLFGVRTVNVGYSGEIVKKGAPTQENKQWRVLIPNVYSTRSNLEVARDRIEEDNVTAFELYNEQHTWTIDKQIRDVSNDIIERTLHPNLTDIPSQPDIESFDVEGPSEENGIEYYLTEPMEDREKAVDIAQIMKANDLDLDTPMPGLVGLAARVFEQNTKSVSDVLDNIEETAIVQ